MIGTHNLDSGRQEAAQSGKLRLKVVKSKPPFEINLIAGTLESPLTVRFPRAAGIIRLGISFAGTAQVFKDSHHPYLVCNQTASLCVEVRDYYATFGRGEHKWAVVTIPDSSLEALNAPLKELGVASCSAHTIYLGTTRQSMHSLLQDLEHALDDETKDCRALLTSIYSFMTQIAIEDGFKQEVILAEIPPSVTGSLASLLEQVKADPSRPWSLKDAANEAAYSAFHLSRIFRTFANYGFPELVDRCRTERAVKLLLETDQSVDEISNECGYGSTQALRNSCREYLGLLPSELKSTREEL